MKLKINEGDALNNWVMNYITPKGGLYVYLFHCICVYTNKWPNKRRYFGWYLV